LNTSSFAVYLIPLGLKKLLRKESHDVPHGGAYPHLVMIDIGGFLTSFSIAGQPRNGYERLAVEPTPQDDAADVCHLYIIHICET